MIGDYSDRRLTESGGFMTLSFSDEEGHWSPECESHDRLHEWAAWHAFGEATDFLPLPSNLSNRLSWLVREYDGADDLFDMEPRLQSLLSS